MMTLSRVFAVSLLLGLAATRLPAAQVAYETAWQSLFNGKNLDNWTVKCAAADKNKKFWTVEGTDLVADASTNTAHGPVYLVSNQKYTNFILRLKFRCYRDNPGNSGVFIRSRFDETNAWLNGPKVDIYPPASWRTGMIRDETRGNQRWLSPNLAEYKSVEESQAKPGMIFFYKGDTNEWNDLSITARGMKIRVVLNGMIINEYDGEGVLDDDAHKDFKVGTGGVLALQIPPADKLKIKFKDIKILEIY